MASGSDDKSLCITNITTQEKVYTAECDSQVRAFLPCFVLTLHQGVGRRLVIRQKDSDRCDNRWQCLPSHEQQCALVRVQNRQGCMYHVRRSFFAHPLFSWVDARSVPVGSLQSVELIEQSRSWTQPTTIRLLKHYLDWLMKYDIGCLLLTFTVACAGEMSRVFS